MTEQERTPEDGAPQVAAPPAEDAPAPDAAPPPVAEAPASAPSEAAEPADQDAARGGDRRRRHFGRRKVCGFCIEKVKEIDYKDAGKLRRYLSDRGRIEARRKTGTCAKHQRWLAVALKRARHLALLPYSPEHIRVSGITTGRRA